MKNVRHRGYFRDVRVNSSANRLAAGTAASPSGNAVRSHRKHKRLFDTFVKAVQLPAILTGP